MSGAGIGRFMGGGYMLFPKAEMNDGLLDVYVIEPVSFSSFCGTYRKS